MVLTVIQMQSHLLGVKVAAFGFRAIGSSRLPGRSLRPIRTSLFSSSSIIHTPSQCGVSTLHIPNLKDPSLLLLTGIDKNDDNSSTSSSLFDVLNPASKDEKACDAVVASVPRMHRQQAVDAIDLAQRMFDQEWRDTTAQYRSNLLTKWSHLIQENADDLAAIMTMESGKPLAESRGEVAYGASFLDYFAAEALRPTSAGGGFLSPTPFTYPDTNRPRGTVMATKEPVGVCAMITPWNFPLAMITRKVGPALAAGCTAVVKPSETTPLSAIAVQTLALRAGIPKGVLQLITAEGREDAADVGQEFCTNPNVKKISFTGSTAVGKILMKQSSDTVKRLSLELGGNAPFIVFADADLDQAVKAAMASKFRNAGQTCVCADRFLVEAPIEEEFVHRLQDAMIEDLQVGDGVADGTTMGPLISSAAVKVVHKKVEDAIDNGAECLEGGHALPDLGPNFYAPTLLVNVKPGRDEIWDSETFGPVVAVSHFHTEHEAVEMANDTTSGLASYFFTQDLSRILRVSRR
jgi:succinate-semialdehyde dehydrogenase